MDICCLKIRAMVRSMSNVNPNESRFEGDNEILDQITKVTLVDRTTLLNHSLNTRCCFERFLDLLRTSLLELLMVFQTTTADINDRRNGKYDIFVFTLVRYCEQFAQLLKGVDDPLSVIEDPDARLIWEKTFGASTISCNFELFYSKILQPRISCQCSPKNAQNMSSCLKFFLNFPKDDIITPYKWNILNCQWGPFPVLFQQIQEYAIKPGFVGLVTPSTAETLLSAIPGTHYLLRFSKAVPKTLTLSVRGSNIWHFRKPLNQPISKLFERFQQNPALPIRESLDCVKLQKTDSLSQYVANGSYFVDPYYIRDVNPSEQKNKLSSANSSSPNSRTRKTPPIIDLICLDRVQARGSAPSARTQIIY